ncbi:MAG: lysozyme [Elusimicrobia bacterium]|jgi:lysozyme|nr:lysozyme [Elusimicrobiota bacterium]
MDISQNGIDLIKRFEGCRLTAYKCPANVWTIGYGHTGSDVKQGLTITQEQAEKLLKSDLVVHCNNVSKLVKVPLNQNQFDALVSFEYNLGYGNLSRSTLLALINQKKFKEASEEFKKWKYAGGKVLAGLVKRREAEKELFIKV